MADMARTVLLLTLIGGGIGLILQGLFLLQPGLAYGAALLLIATFLAAFWSNQ